MKSLLFSPIKIKGVDFKNRIFMSPMCQYSAIDGLVNDWHLTHYTSRAIGGVGAIIVEATAVEPRGRITPYDLGLYNSDQAKAFETLVKSVKKYDAKIGIQLAHAGRKGSKDVPWRQEKPLSKDEGGYEIIAPSVIAFDENSQIPRQMNKDDIEFVKNAFVNSAKMAEKIGFDFLEIHMAHGYLLHEFLSGLSNNRSDEYGGSFENRIRFPLEVAQSIRETVKDIPVFVRISATDWVNGGWDLSQSIEFTKRLKAIGVDLIDVSSGGLVDAQIESNFGYQTAFSKEIKDEAEILASAVGLIVNAYQAEHILSTNQADIIVLGRALLSDPYWPLHAARTLGVEAIWPNQYLRARHI